MKKIVLVLILAALTGVFVLLKTTDLFSAAARNSLVGQNGSADENCSEGWRVTGYFTPIETDYDSAATVEVKVGNAGKIQFNADFLRIVFDENEGFGEGWGKTRFGWYLGNYNGAWHKADAPLDANNEPLKTNSVAVDNALIPNDSIVKIPGLPDAFGEKNFVADDVGVTVHGKHIDVYTGEGRAAEQEMNRVTFEDDKLQKVCYRKP